MARTLALIFLPLVLSVIVATLGAIDYFRRDAQRALADRALQTINLLVGGVAEAMWNVDRATLRVLLQPLADDPDFAGVLVLNTDGTVFMAMGDTAGNGRDANRDRIVERLPLTHVGRNRNAGTERIGTLELRLSTAQAEQAVALRAWTIALIGLGLLMTVCGLLVVIVREITAPIRIMTGSLTALVSGKVDVPVPETRRPDEIGRMAQALEILKTHAAERLRFIERQAHHVEEIERTVERRTRELRDTLDTLRHAQNELVRAERMAALGGMVAAIAHEINTPLGNALTVSTTLGERIDEFQELLNGRELRRSTLREHSESLNTASRLLTANLLRAADLIGRFKRVAVDQTSEQRRRFQLDAVCAEVVAMIQPTCKRSGVAVELALPPGVVMDSFPGALGQILTNLVANALLHAFGDTADRGPSTAAVIRVVAETAPGSDGGDHDATDHVWLCVEDNGCGIPPTILPRIFDPFFTTKLGAGGSGLGLHIVYAIVTRVLGGTIAVDSTPGIGTRFTVTLPCVAPEVAPEAAPDQAAADGDPAWVDA